MSPASNGLTPVFRVTSAPVKQLSGHHTCCLPVSASTKHLHLFQSIEPPRVVNLNVFHSFCAENGQRRPGMVVKGFSDTYAVVKVFLFRDPTVDGGSRPTKGQRRFREIIPLFDRQLESPAKTRNPRSAVFTRNSSSIWENRTQRPLLSATTTVSSGPEQQILTLHAYRSQLRIRLPGRE